MPRSKQACPNSAACWSPATPAHGHAGQWRRTGRRRPTRSDRRTACTSGSADSGTPNRWRPARPTIRLADVEEQCPARRWSTSGGEDATVGAAGQVPQHPRVDRGEGQAGAASATTAFGGAATPSWWPRSRGRARGRSSSRTAEVAGSASSSHRRAVRRSCQTMARCSGRPVDRSQATTVSRWLVIPMAAGGSVCLRSVRASSSSVAANVVQISIGVVLDPSGPGEVLGRAPGRRRRRPGLARPRPGPGPRSCPASMANTQCHDRAKPYRGGAAGARRL